MAQTIKTIEEFGGNGNGSFDNYAAFQAAASYAATHPNTTIKFGVGTYYIAQYRTIDNDPITHVFWRNCQSLYIEGAVGGGTKIDMNGNFFRPLDYVLSGGAKKSYTSGLCPFHFYHCVDVQVSNLELDGNVDQTTRAPGIDEFNPSVTESNSIGLRFEMCTTVRVTNMDIHHFESDGVMIAGDRPAVDWVNTTDVVFLNVNTHNNGRQGMSAGGLSNGIFKQCSFNYNGYTGGTYGFNDPAAGVDIEPGPYHACDNILFQYCIFQENHGSCFICSYPDTTHDVTLSCCRLKTVIEGVRVQGMTILATNALVQGCDIILADREIKITNSSEPGSTIRMTNNYIEGSDAVTTSSSTSPLDDVLIDNNRFVYTKNTLTKNFINLNVSKLRFLNNDILIPKAAVLSRPTGSHSAIKNAIISSGNLFHTEVAGTKPRVDYTGTITVADL